MPLSTRRATAATAYAFLVAMLGTTMPTALYPTYQQRYGYHELTITVIFAVYAAGVLTALVVLGRWSDDVGRRPALLVGIAAAVVSGICFVLADGLPLLLVGRFVSGLSAGLFTSAATVALVELGGPERRSRSALLATAVNMLGLGLGPTVAGAVAVLLPAPLVTPYVVHVALVLVAGLLLLRVPETAPGPRRRRLRLQRIGVPASVRPVFVPAAVGGFAGFLVLGFFAAVAPAVVGSELGVRNPVLVGGVTTVTLVASAVGQLALERIPERLRIAVPCALLVVGALLVALAIATASAVVLLLGAVVAGSGQGLTLRGGIAAVTAASPERERGAVTASLFLLLYVAISLPVIGVGVLAELDGVRVAGITAALVVAAIAAVAVVAATRLARRTP